VIKIVYRNLSPGLHASAEAEGRNTVIAFLPGLTPEQRRAALRRIRHSGRMGHGTRVPRGRLAIALTLDRVRAGARTCTAVVRQHPAGSTLPVAFFSAAAVIFVLMATVSIHVLPAPRSSSQGPAVGGVSPVPGMSAPVDGQRGAPSWTSPGTPRGSTTPGRLAARQLAAGTSAAGSRGVPSGPQGSGRVTGPGSGQATASSGSGAGSGTGSSGTGSSGTGSSGSGTSSSGTGSSGSGTGGSGSGGSGTGGSGTGGSGSGGSGTGSTGSGGTGTGSGSGGSGSGGSGSGGSGSGGSGSGPSGSGSGSGGGSGSGSPGSGSGSGSSGSGGGTCVNVLGIVQACVGL